MTIKGFRAAKSEIRVSMHQSSHTNILWASELVYSHFTDLFLASPADWFPSLQPILNSKQEEEEGCCQNQPLTVVENATEDVRKYTRNPKAKYLGAIQLRANSPTLHRHHSPVKSFKMQLPSSLLASAWYIVGVDDYVQDTFWKVFQQKGIE